MKAWMKLSGIFINTVIAGAFLVCVPIGNGAFANDSLLAQRPQAAPSGVAPSGKASKGSVGEKAQPPTFQPPPPPSPHGYPHGEPPKKPVLEPAPNPSVVNPPPGMTMCTFTNANGVVMAILVWEGSTCHINADGSVTVTFWPDGTTYTVPKDTIGGVFYTDSFNPIIIVPYRGSTVTIVPNSFPSDIYQVVFPDGRVYLLPTAGPGIQWFLPPEPLPLQVPLVKPPGMTMFTFTNAYGDEVVILAPPDCTFTLNPDGSVTIRFPDGTKLTIPSDARAGTFTTGWWSAVVVPKYGTTIWQWGSGQYSVNFPDGNSIWLNWYWPPKPTVFPRPPMPSGLGIAPGHYKSWLYFGGYLPVMTPYYTAVGVPGIEIYPLGNRGMRVIFPDGTTFDVIPVQPGPYSYTVMVDPDGPFGEPAHPVTYRFAVILEGSTVTSNGDGTYHVDPPPGSGGLSFDFQYP